VRLHPGICLARRPNPPRPRLFFGLIRATLWPVAFSIRLSSILAKPPRSPTEDKPRRARGGLEHEAQQISAGFPRCPAYGVTAKWNWLTDRPRSFEATPRRANVWLPLVQNPPAWEKKQSGDASPTSRTVSIQPAKHHRA
jgi:hypothetical protein